MEALEFQTLADELTDDCIVAARAFDLANRRFEEGALSLSLRALPAQLQSDCAPWARRKPLD